MRALRDLLVLARKLRPPVPSALYKTICCATAFIVLTLPSVAAGQPQVLYVSAGEKILELTVVNGAVSGSVKEIHKSAVGIVGDLARSAADGKVYFSEPGRVSRINPSGGLKGGVNVTAEVVFTSLNSTQQPRELRVEATGALLVGTPSGVLRIPAGTLAQLPAGGVGPNDVEPVTNTGTGGVGITHTGEIIYTDSNSVKRLPGTGFTQINLTAPVGLDVANGGSNPGFFDSSAANVGKEDIIASSGNQLLRYSRGGGTAIQMVSFPAGDLVQFFVITSNQTLFVATAKDPTQGISVSGSGYNGRFWLVDLDGAGSGPATLTSILTPDKTQGKSPPVIGVAASASSRTVSDIAATSGTRQYKFGATLFEVTTPSACQLSVEARQISKAEANALLQNNQVPPIDPTAFLSEESWYTLYDVDVLSPSNNSKCGATPTQPVSILIAGFTAVASANYAVVKFGDNPPPSAPGQVITVGLYPFFAPDDAAAVGDSDGFSSFMLGLVVPETGPATFCGLNAPFNRDPIVPPLTPEEIQAALRSGSTATYSVSQGGDPVFKFVLSSAGLSGCQTPSTFVPDVPIYTPNGGAQSGALFSIQRLTDLTGNPIPKVIDVQPSPPLFAVNQCSPASPSTQNCLHRFEWDRTDGGVPVGVGLYVVTISSLDDRFSPISILLKLTP